MCLELDRKSVWKSVDEDGYKEIMAYGERYKNFLNVAKNERESVDFIVEQAKKNGFISLSEALENGVKKGDKIYHNEKNKSVVLFVIGNDLTEGMTILGAHLDSPRLDIKQNPLYQDSELAYLKTHYYGGIKKYPWLTVPLALHGYVKTKSGREVSLNIGEDENEPVFYINDLLAHFSREQVKKPASEFVSAEQLNIVVGHSSFGADDDKNPIKKLILKHLNEKYSIVEEDFAVAEFHAVPAGKARDVGFDKSLIASYGHDDSVCAYACLEAIFDVESTDRTVVGIFVDKEEIGSVGNTSMSAKFFENVVAEIINSMRDDYSDLLVRRAFSKSKALSADVTAALDPDFREVSDEKNAAILGYGITINKYTGAGGKFMASDANAEFLAEVRDIFNKNGVLWQTAVMGKTDMGGGGTIAYILAEHGVEILDCGTAMLSMHSPIELVSKADAYMTFKGYRAFLSI